MKQKFKIAAKSAFNKESLDDLVCKGFHFVEIQLLNHINKEDIDEYMKMMEDYPSLTIVSIHTPLFKDKNEEMSIEINRINNSAFYQDLKMTCSLADKLGKKYNRKIAVVLHNSMDICDYYCYSELQYSIKEKIEKILELYQNIDLCLENITPYYRASFRGGINPLDLNEVAKLFECSTTLDICHIETTNEFFRRIEKEKYCFKFSDIIPKMKSTLKVIHFNHAVGLGYRKNHSSPLVDSKIIDEIIKALDINNIYPLIVLEVNEDDYSNHINLMTAANALKDRLKELNIAYEK